MRKRRERRETTEKKEEKMGRTEEMLNGKEGNKETRRRREMIL